MNPVRWWSTVVIAAALVPAHAEDGGFSRGQVFDERSGEALYRSICQGCHMPDGRGARGAGVYPALANDAKLQSAGYPLLIVLNGNRNMPSFARSLDDAQVAAVVGYVRTHFGNAYADAITTEQVAKLRVEPGRAP